MKHFKDYCMENIELFPLVLKFARKIMQRCFLIFYIIISCFFFNLFRKKIKNFLTLNKIIMLIFALDWIKNFGILIN